MLFDNKLKADKKNIHAIFMNDSQLGIKYGLLQTEHLLGMHTASFASFVRDRVTSMLLTHFRKTYVPFFQAISRKKNFCLKKLIFKNYF